ncbi:hypothetical protein YC2023_102648 [Brassica napus]
MGQLELNGMGRAALAQHSERPLDSRIHSRPDPLWNFWNLEKEKKIIKTNYFTTIWSVVKEALRKNMSTFKKIRYFSCGEYLVTMCSHQGAHCAIKQELTEN